MSPRQWIVNVNEVNEWACERSSERVIEPAIESDRAIDRASERSSERSSNQLSERLSDRAIGRTIERSSKRAIERSNDRASERSSDRGIERTRVYAYTRVYTRIQVYTGVCTRIHAYTRVHTCTHAYTHVYMCRKQKVAKQMTTKKNVTENQIVVPPAKYMFKIFEGIGLHNQFQILSWTKRANPCLGVCPNSAWIPRYDFFRKLIKFVPPRRRGITKGSLRDYYGLRNLSFYRIITSRESANPFGVSEAILYSPTLFRPELFQHWLYSQRWIQQPVGHSRLTAPRL